MKTELRAQEFDAEQVLEEARIKSGESVLAC